MKLKENFFYPSKNKWDIGWSCSPRLMLLTFIIVSSSILMLYKYGVIDYVFSNVFNLT